MKQFRLLSTTLATCMTLFLFSCGSGNNKTEEKKSDTTQVKSAETIPEVASVPKVNHLVILRHKVANFSKWKMAFDADESARLANGLSPYGIGRGIPDSNMVVVIMRSDNIIKAKEFTSSEELKEVMKKAGVMGQPAISYLDIAMNDDSKTEQTQRLMVTHKVKDWDVWKKEFDSHKQTRMDAGLIDRRIGYNSGDSHYVTMIFAVTDMAKAKAFLASKDLKDKMTAAGVEGPPAFFFYNIAQSY